MYKRNVFILILFLTTQYFLYADNFDKYFVKNGNWFYLDQSKEQFCSNGFGFIHVDKELNIYVPDYMAANVKKYDKTGKLLHVYGSRGEGPGELNFPYKVIVKNNKVIVNDIQSLYLTVFDVKTGKFASKINVPMGCRNLVMNQKEDIFLGVIFHYDRKYKIVQLSDSNKTKSKSIDLNIFTDKIVDSQVTFIMDFDSDENIYLGFRLSYKVAVFDKNLNFIRILGKPGNNWNPQKEEVLDTFVSQKAYNLARSKYTYLFNLFILNDKYILLEKTVSGDLDSRNLTMYTLNGKIIFEDVLTNAVIAGKDHLSNLYLYDYEDTSNDIKIKLCKYRLRNNF